MTIVPGMTGPRLRLALAAGFALAVVALTAFAVAGSASAHESDCHAQQTCPSDDYSYTWSDGTTLWDCGLASRDYGDVPPTPISYDGVDYTCFEVPTGTTPEPPAPPPLPPEDDDLLTEPPAPKPKRKPKPNKQPEAEEPAADEPVYGPTFSAKRPPVLPPGRYVFPLDGPASYTDTFGAARATTGWHHGEDIFAPLGTPVLAVGDGTLLRVGWNAIGGNRVWMRDRWGNYFYYAHLSGFAPGAVSGAPVFRGEVIGYVGNTGDAAGTPYHLHFEIHPASLVDLGYDGVVNPNPYLGTWQRALTLQRQGIAIGRPVALTPGAILLTAADISTASGLEPGAVMRSVAAPVQIDAEQRVLPPLPPATRVELPGTEDGTALTDILDTGASEFPGSQGATVWDTLSQCESSGDWHLNTGIYDGGLQFHPDTWLRYGGAAFAPYAYLATREQQITIAKEVLEVEGWEAWPACSLKLGLR